MGCRTQFCIGGGCVPTSSNPQEWLSAFGYTFNPDDPLTQVYRDLIAQSPASLQSIPAWAALAEACMRSRALLFCNQTPGDSGSTFIASTNANLLNATASIGNTATGIISGIKSIAKAAPLVGDAFNILLSAFQAHAQAEQNQANALGKLCPYVTDCIRQADQQVASGANPDDAVNFLRQSFMEAKAAWQPLEKTCNAFCWYNAILDLLANVSQHYYQLPLTNASLEQSDETNIIPPDNSPSITAAISGKLSGTTISVIVLILIALVVGGRK